MSAKTDGILVTPELLYSTADDVIGRNKAAESAFEDMHNIVKRTSSFWIGEAGDHHRELFESKVPQMETIFKRFSEHAAHLKSMAANYVQVEAEVTAEAEALPSDVVI